jgi:hypothetical protein
MLQTQVTSHTEKLDAQRANGDATPQMQAKILAVHDEQEKVHQAVQKLQDELSGS